jgi:hypothetical protein
LNIALAIVLVLLLASPGRFLIQAAEDNINNVTPHPAGSAAKESQLTPNSTVSTAEEVVPSPGNNNGSSPVEIDNISNPRFPRGTVYQIRPFSGSLPDELESIDTNFPQLSSLQQQKEPSFPLEDSIAEASSSPAGLQLPKYLQAFVQEVANNNEDSSSSEEEEAGDSSSVENEPKPLVRSTPLASLLGESSQKEKIKIIAPPSKSQDKSYAFG